MALIRLAYNCLQADELEARVCVCVCVCVCVYVLKER
jgi:hypothetical protein